MAQFRRCAAIAIRARSGSSSITSYGLNPKDTTFSRRSAMADDHPSLAVRPKVVDVSVGIQVIGAGWRNDPVHLSLDEWDGPSRLRVLRGEQHGDDVRPLDGSFVALLDSPGLNPGRHTVEAVEVDRTAPLRARDDFELLDISRLEDDGRPTMRWLRRVLDFSQRRFPDGFPQPGTRLRALADRDAMRAQPKDKPAPPVDPGPTWYPIGPSVVRDGQVFGISGFTVAPISGRVTDIAIDPHDPQTLYVATAQGGLWKSVNGGRDWDPKTDSEISLACGSVTVDPSVLDAAGRSARILVGTGEPNRSDSYFGAGMLLSTDGGDTWVSRGTAQFIRAAFSTIAVDPASSRHLLAATDEGVYESTDEGIHWELLDAGPSYDLVVDWGNVEGAAVFVGRSGVGIRRRVGNGPWITLAGGLPAAPGRIALAMAPSSPSTLWAAIPTAAKEGPVKFYRTTDGGDMWTAAAGVVAGKQLGYNLVLAVHPTDAGALLFGEVRLWRSTDGGATWTNVSAGSPGIHADQHALAFHPTDGTKVYAGNDGGIWYSSDGGATWRHRNKDLATLQYFGAAGHGNYEAVMLGGTQDNGAQRYVGHPAWQHSAPGDGAFCAISRTGDTYQWYESRFWTYPCFRSDATGAPGTWVEKHAGITTNDAWFYPPMVMDPSDSSVLYVGYDKLYRSSDRADTWTAITGVVSEGKNITAVTVTPSNSDIVYVGLQNGHVFRVARSGGSWTATDVSAEPLPAGQISDIAVHPMHPDTVYVTTSDLIFSEGAFKSFVNDHVYRTIDGGGTWKSVSAGLSQANPVNSILIDPKNPRSVFIGCDVGIFRSPDGGDSWVPWDEGLPNCSVQDLQLFEPGRLLRAATHGRSIWERPIDPEMSPPVQLYVRDNFLDTGRGTPSPSGVVDPFDATGSVYWWQSADIKVDSPDPATGAFTFPDMNVDYLQFEHHQHEDPPRHAPVRVYVQVHVRGNQPATNVRVRMFWADGNGPPPLPADFWAAFPNADPSDTTWWHPLGPTHTIPVITVGRPGVTGWDWQVPTDAPARTCLLAVVTSDEDPIPALTTRSVGAAVNSSNHVALKNVQVDSVSRRAQGSGVAAGPYTFGLSNLSEDATMDVRFNTRGLPPATRLIVALPRLDAPFEVQGGLRSVPANEVVSLELHALEQHGRREGLDLDWRRVLVLETGDATRLRRGEELPGLTGVQPGDRRFVMAFLLAIPDADFERSLTFHVEQWEHGELSGGSSYELRPESLHPRGS
jgi:photosystem II stability/assembly factor-like uncharacterized protein